MRDEKQFGRVLITGVAGAGASYLAEYIAREKPWVEIHGVARWHSQGSHPNLAAVRDRVKVHELELRDLSAILAVMRDVKPDVVFHMAAFSNARASFGQAASVLENNVIGTTNVLEAARLSGADPIFKLCSTAAVYGEVRPDEVPIREEIPLRPVSPYGVSKVAQDLMGRVYFLAHGLKVIRTRMFAYLNPRRPDLFATAFARQVAWIEAGQAGELVHGNLESVRTMVDVRDAVRAYWDAVLHCEPGEVYNVGGTARFTVGDVLKKLIARAHVPIKTRLDRNLSPPADVALQVPAIDKFVSATRWQPKHTLDESLQLLLDHWRAQVKAQPT